MNWNVEFIDAAKKDLKKLDRTQQVLVLKAIDKVRRNPTAQGCGKPLGNKAGAGLAGLMKIKLRDSGIRVVYKLVDRDGVKCWMLYGSS